MTIRVGVIGAGVMGTDHIRTLTRSVSGATVGAVCDIDQERARRAVEGIPEAKVHAHPGALIQDGDIDAVLVASSDATHEEYVLACLDVAKPVLCEKPLAPTRQGAQRILDAEQAVGRRLVSVGFMRRYDEGYAALARKLEDGSIGQPLLVHCVHRNSASPPNLPSEVLVTGSAVHEIDIVRWLLREDVRWVSGYRPRRSALVPGETQDPLFLVFETDSGVVVDVEVFANAQYGYDVRCELVGERGAVTLDAPAGAVVRASGQAARGVAVDWRDRFAGAYRRELQDWVDGWVDGEARGASAWDGYAATAVAEAAVAAIAAGARRPVEL